MDATPMVATYWEVAAEYDDDAFARLSEVLRSLGYRVTNEWHGVTGSQDVSHWELSGPAGCVTLERETYVGLTIEGPSAAVAEIRGSYESAT